MRRDEIEKPHFSILVFVADRGFFFSSFLCLVSFRDSLKARGKIILFVGHFGVDYYRVSLWKIRVKGPRSGSSLILIQLQHFIIISPDREDLR